MVLFVCKFTLLYLYLNDAHVNDNRVGPCFFPLHTENYHFIQIDGLVKSPILVLRITVTELNPHYVSLAFSQFARLEHDAFYEIV